MYIAKKISLFKIFLKINQPCKVKKLDWQWYKYYTFLFEWMKNVSYKKTQATRNAYINYNLEDEEKKTTEIFH